ncbi:hypothetical protein DQ384_09145 [Sphaerisporangium album]|uniref:Uncharacterized protein n=1 Tax=Sphaerisporangium album TaxID=509200 RepID=A0A367FN65_9ACTN|nr:hypothetical protein [Sphaerisporangium album]RCG31701.1 hypothetical protein DQ384_09145 [Sphaerisporangium album]
MSDAEQQPGHHGLLHGLAERISEHHERAAHRREEEELAEAADSVGFDLDADLGHPTRHHTAAAYDLDADLGVANESPDRRA